MYRSSPTKEPFAKAPEAQKPIRINSEELFRARQEVLIVHNGREYRLRLTQHGKLILTA